jgi:hypothetical protein
VHWLEIGWEKRAGLTPAEQARVEEILGQP